MTETKYHRIQRRHARVRRRISGTPERPRLVFRRTSRHIYAQVINDVEGRSIVQLSTTRKDFALSGPDRSGRAAARIMGEEIARTALEKGVSKVVFDRGGFVYHGVVKEFAEAARSAGLDF
mgnify:CR=1 FL=1